MICDIAPSKDVWSLSPTGSGGTWPVGSFHHRAGSRWTNVPLGCKVLMKFKASRSTPSVAMDMKAIEAATSAGFK